MYKLLAALYTDTTSSVISESGVESRVFKISEGVRQGDPLSCILFNLFFNDLVEAIDGPSGGDCEEKGSVEEFTWNRGN